MRSGPEYPTVVSLALNQFNQMLMLLFLVCKLTGQIDWPWVWVLSPIWIPLVVSFLLVGFLVARRLNKTIPDWREAQE